MSFAETIELAVKASQRLARKISRGGTPTKGPNNSNRGKDDGEEVWGVDGVAMVGEVDPGAEGKVLVVVQDGAVQVDSILWLATGVGCLAIWPMTVPPLVVRR